MDATGSVRMDAPSSCMDAGGGWGMGLEAPLAWMPRDARMDAGYCLGRMDAGHSKVLNACLPAFFGALTSGVLRYVCTDKQCANCWIIAPVCGFI